MLARLHFLPGAGNVASASDREPAEADTALPPWLYLLFCALSLVPFVAVAHPPIVDFANHAARLTLQCAIAEPAVSDMYEFRYGAIPNLAVDLLNLPLCGIASATAVLKGAILGALAIVYAAGWSIQVKLFGRANPLLLLVPATSVNLVTGMGYINFLVGIAVLAVMVRLMLGAAGDARRRLAIGNLGGVLLFFSHIFALAVAMVFFFGWFAAKGPLRPKPLALAVVRTIAMFALPLLLIPLVESSRADFTVAWENKARLLLALGVLLPLLYLLKKRLAFVHPTMRLPLAALGAYVLLVPGQLQDAVDIDARSAVALGWLFVASLGLAAGAGRTARLLPWLAALPLAGHLAQAATVWRSYDAQVAEFRAATEMLPAQARLLSVQNFAASPASGATTPSPMVYWHLASWATIDRRVFNPLEFTGSGMQPMQSRGRFAAIDISASPPVPDELAGPLAAPDSRLAEAARQNNLGFALRWAERFDYVLYYHFGTAPNFDPKRLRLLHRGSFFSILQVRRPAPR